MISVCIPTYGRPELLEEAMASFFYQSCTDKELIIINDREDQTLVFDHPLVKVVNLKDRMTTGAKRALAAEMAKGEYLAFWDDDDIHLRGHLSDLEERIKKTDHKDFVRQGYRWFDAGGMLYRFDKVVMLHTAVMRKDKYLSMGGHSPLVQGEDTDFVKRIRAANIHVQPTVEPHRPTFIWRKSTGRCHVSDYPTSLYSDLQIQSILKDEADSANVSGDIKLDPKWNKNYEETANRSWGRVRDSLQ